MSKDVLTELADIFNIGVKHGDKKGLAEVYKKAADVLFKALQNNTNIELHIEDIEYCDGYFIFGFGTNSVVHFHIKETPGWLYGVWWDAVETEETKNKKRKVYCGDRVKCTIFTQYEDIIDKFKPSRSEYCSEFTLLFNLDDFYDDKFDDFCYSIEFINKEPYLAFYRDYTGANFNHEYISREKAKRCYDKYIKEKQEKTRVNAINAQAMFDAIKTFLHTDVEHNEAFIYDHGSSMYPRYEIVLKNIWIDKSGNKGTLVDQEGCYGLFSFYDKNAQKLFDKVNKECNKRTKYWWDNPFSDNCMIVNPDSYNKWLKEGIKNNTVLYYRKKDKTVFESKPKAAGEE